MSCTVRVICQSSNQNYSERWILNWKKHGYRTRASQRKSRDKNHRGWKETIIRLKKISMNFFIMCNISLKCIGSHWKSNHSAPQYQHYCPQLKRWMIHLLSNRSRRSMCYQHHRAALKTWNIILNYVRCIRCQVVEHFNPEHGALSSNLILLKCARIRRN